MEIGLGIEVEVRDKDGKLIKEIKKEADSYLLNFIKAVRGLMYGHCRNKSVSLVDTGGTARTYPNLSTYDKNILSVNAPAGNANYGIWIGYGTTEVTPEDYTLASKAPTTDFDYNASTVESVTYDASEGLFRIIRTFTNISGVDKTITEIGLVFNEYQASSPYNVYFMIARDILPSSILVPSGGTITVRYIIRVTW